MNWGMSKVANERRSEARLRAPAGAVLKGLYNTLGKPASLAAFNTITATTKCNAASLAARIKCSSNGRIISL